MSSEKKQLAVARCFRKEGVSLKQKFLSPADLTERTIRANACPAGKILRFFLLHCGEYIYCFRSRVDALAISFSKAGGANPALVPKLVPDHFNQFFFGCN